QLCGYLFLNRCIADRYQRLKNDGQVIKQYNANPLIRFETLYQAFHRAEALVVRVRLQHTSRDVGGNNNILGRPMIAEVQAVYKLQSNTGDQQQHKRGWYEQLPTLVGVAEFPATPVQLRRDVFGKHA